MKITFSLPYLPPGSVERCFAQFEADVSSEKFPFTAGQEQWHRVLERAHEVVADLQRGPVERAVDALVSGAVT